MEQDRRILATGGAGFVGATLVRQLVAAGQRGRVFDDYSTGDPAHLAGVDAELVEGDIRDADALDAALAGIDAVVHLAAAGSVIMSITDPAANFDVNVLGTFQVLDAARRAGEVERNFASYDLASKMLGYAPSIDREDGIRRTWQWFTDSVFTA